MNPVEAWALRRVCVCVSILLRSELRSTHGFFKMKMCVFAQSGAICFLH